MEFYKLKKIILAILLMAFSYQAYAEGPDWLMEAIRVGDPNQLEYFLVVDEQCPITHSEGQEIINGVFIRSRIKPLPQSLKGIYLSVNLFCLEPKSIFHTYKLGVAFARALPLPAVLFDFSFDSFGVKKKNGMEQSLKNQTEEAITTFIKANFDL